MLRIYMRMATAIPSRVRAAYENYDKGGGRWMSVSQRPCWGRHWRGCGHDTSVSIPTPVSTPHLARLPKGNFKVQSYCKRLKSLSLFTSRISWDGFLYSALEPCGQHGNISTFKFIQAMYYFSCQHPTSFPATGTRPLSACLVTSVKRSPIESDLISETIAWGALQSFLFYLPQCQCWIYWLSC